ncbi:hypothetical protein [Haloechinothrix sp. LS1_15]|uniref:hypothetical protein n=1 Tax=Haloechinothrix sp. LS1_15 TaxID=2652248 RepID=UPI002946249D|nr:hypothetical protein [Haloechinothrix sp. LS1_15]MDV6013629.1 hypothetical protein [Haloechinothrix sp. LS1_15]
MGSRIALVAGMGAVVLVTATGDTQDGLPGQPLESDEAYILTQQHRDNLPWWNNTWVPQTVPSGAHIQVQLPSDPVEWVPEHGRDCEPSPVADLVPTSLLPLRADVELLDTDTLPNSDRMTGSSEISVFSYRVSGVGIAAVCLRPEPDPADPAQLGFPPGTPSDYVVTLVVGVPQASLP